jgi:hypothetical protein
MRDRPIILAAIAMVVGIAVVSAVWFGRSSRTPPPAATTIKSLAVLPVLNISGDQSQDYFADGMTETLIAGLAKVTALRVTARTSVMQFKGSQKAVEGDCVQNPAWIVHNFIADLFRSVVALHLKKLAAMR